MRAALRILAIGGGVAALLLIAVAVAIATIDVNAFAGPIQQWVKDATGRDFAIGSIGLTRSLTPKLVLDGVALGNAPWGKAPQLLTARRIEARVRLLPLLQRRVEIVRLDIVEPVIALETAGDGRVNWAFGHGAAGAAPAGAPTEATPAAAALGALAVGSVAIERGVLRYRNDVSGRTTSVAIDTLALTARGPDSPVRVEFRGKVDAVALEFEGELGALAALQQRRWPYPVRVQGEIGGRKLTAAGKLTVADGAVRVDDLELAHGTSAVKGRLAVATGGARPKVEFDLAADALAVADLPPPPARSTTAAGTSAAAPASGGGPASGPGTGAAPATGDGTRRHLFPDAPADFAPLRSIDVLGDVAVDRLTLADGRRVDHLRAHVAVNDGRAEVTVAEAAAFGGSTRMHVVVDAAGSAAPRIAVQLDARGLDLSALLAAGGAAGEVRGGKTDVHVDLKLRGDSSREWASTATGTVTASVGPATIVHGKRDAPSELDRLADAANPFRRVDAATELQCAALRLPLDGGVARVDHGIAVETKKVGIAASGVVDLRDETVDLSIQTSVRAGIPVDLAQFAGLVRLQGPLAAPRVVIDPKSSASAVARLGAAYASGGLSLLGESLLARGTKGGECDVALGRTPPPGAGNAPATSEPRGKPSIDDVVKSLERLLHR